MASEMLYPIMPVYLKSIGFSILLIGILEGLAEATAGLSKGYFGKLSDATGRRAPFVQIGYALSAISKPLMGLFITPWWIFIARTLDRLGKGVRTGARDAILSDETTIENKARVFGFHRSMDTLGAVLGPLIALIYLYFYPGNYLHLFYLAFLPGVLAIFASFYIKEKKVALPSSGKRLSFFSFLHYWKTGPAPYRKLVIGLLIFAVFNSSDVFLLLQAKQSGLSDSMVIGVYIFYNLVYALFAYPLGILADKIGIKNILVSGLFLFALIYFGMAFADNIYKFAVLFLFYGIYAAATEGVSKAWISNITDRKETGTAIGTYAGLQSICALLASSFAGLIWFQFGAAATFITTGIISLLVVIYFILMVPSPNKIH